MIRIRICIVLFYLLPGVARSQTEFFLRCDSLIASLQNQGYKGSILISYGDSIKIRKGIGNPSFSATDFLKYPEDHPYSIGSLSKQITAVLVLQAYEKGRIKLHVPINTYLPELKMSWADTVTIHQLLTHTHGIQNRNSPLSFKPGSAFSYSNTGFSLLAEILENAMKIPFQKQCQELFGHSEMKNSFHPANFPDLKKTKICSNGWHIYDTLNNQYKAFDAAAGGIISSAGDLIHWNTLLYTGKLLGDSVFALMSRKYPVAERIHPVFGPTHYGYGITMNPLAGSDTFFGHSGFMPGYASMNYYFPKYRISIVLLTQVECEYSDIRDAFKAHTALIQIAKEEL